MILAAGNKFSRFGKFIKMFITPEVKMIEEF